MGEVALPRPRVRQALGSSVDITVGGEPGVLTVARGPEGAPCWVQLRAGVHGSTLAGLADAVATALTVGLQHGVPGAVLTDALQRAGIVVPGEHSTDLLVETFAPADDSAAEFATRRRDRSDWPVAGVMIPVRGRVFVVSGRGRGVRVSMQPRSRVQIPQQTVLVARAAFPNGSVAMSARDHLGEVFTDEQFAAAFGVRGAPAESPGALALVTALQYTENLTDRQAAQMVARAIDWKYALGLELTDPGFDASVLSKFRTRLVEHGLEEEVFTRMLTVLAGKGLIGAGGKQRTDSTHVISAVRDLNRLEFGR